MSGSNLGVSRRSPVLGSLSPTSLLTSYRVTQNITVTRPLLRKRTLHSRTLLCLLLPVLLLCLLLLLNLLLVLHLLLTLLIKLLTKLAIGLLLVVLPRLLREGVCRYNSNHNDD